MKLTFLGAAQEVTGSCILVETVQSKFLVDCGLFQGEHLSEIKNFAPWPFDPATIDCVILTHAHLDHCGRLPLLCAQKFHGRVYATEPTLDLIPLILNDAAKMLEREGKREKQRVLYTEEAVGCVGRFGCTVSYESTVMLDDAASFRLQNAGHILGSASVVLTVEGETIVFSGDLGNSPAPLLPELVNPEQADVVVIESTYGNRIHEDLKTRRSLLEKVIRATCEAKGVLLIPSFALERTQELLHEIDYLMRQEAIPKLPVFLDSPLAIAVTEVFAKCTDYFNRSAQQHFDRDNFFDFPSLTMTVTEEESKSIEEVLGPKVIIAGSGMMHGGRILRHASRYLPEGTTNLLIIGYQSEGSLGRRLLNRVKEVRIFNKIIPVRAKVAATSGYSAHADQNQLLSWVERMKAKPKQIYLTHGELEAQNALSKKLEERFGLQAILPNLGSSWEIE